MAAPQSNPKGLMVEFWDSGQVRHVRRGPGVPYRTVAATLLAAGAVAAGVAALSGMPVEQPAVASPPAVGEFPGGAGLAPSPDPPAPTLDPGSPASATRSAPGRDPRTPGPGPSMASAGTPGAVPQAFAGTPTVVGLVPMGAQPASSPTSSPGPSVAPRPTPSPGPSVCPTAGPSTTSSSGSYPPRGRKLKRKPH